jgi:biofilm PGA synthesis N-glycosyltransferase PgaC
MTSAVEFKSYVLITPARNEERYVRNTMNSVVSQTVLPEKWVIVSDGSTDRTDDIVAEYARKFDFIKLLRVEAGKQRTFGSKVNAIKYGVEQLKDVKYEFIGNLDADISFEPEYYERMLKAFQDNAKLGVAGGVVLDLHEGRLIKRGGDTNHVAGAVQLFRRECYEAIGGYAPVKAGIEDTVAEVMARMIGWEVKSFPEIKVIHHRRTGTEGQSIYSARFRMGQQDYFLGYHPLFEIAKCVYRIKERPYVIGSLFWMCGYFWSALRRDTRTVSVGFIRYLRREQMNQLWSRLAKT